MTDNAKLTLGDETVDLPVIVGSENEHAIDISKLRAQSGYITLDGGYGNTGACQSGADCGSATHSPAQPVETGAIEKAAPEASGGRN